jgi:tellurite methyltransferase
LRHRDSKEKPQRTTRRLVIGGGGNGLTAATCLAKTETRVGSFDTCAACRGGCGLRYNARAVVEDGVRERWNRRWAGGRHSDGEPPGWLEGIEAFAAASGRALDLASGAGRVALWLAGRGFEVTATDISAVALGRCRASAQAEKLSVEVLEIDLESQPLPRGPWDVITCFHYMRREIFRDLRAALSPGGLLVAEIATRRNMERNERPSERFLLELGELRELLAPLEVVHYCEDWFEGYHVARGVARRG